VHMKCLMVGVIVGAKRVCAWPEDQNGAWTGAQTLRMYEAVMHLFQYRSKSGKSRRHAQLGWKTVYNSFIFHKKRFATELDAGAVATEGGNTIDNEIEVGGV